MVLTVSAASASSPREDAAMSALGSSFTQGTVAVEGTTLHYVKGGSGAPLVLLHGWPQTWVEWAPVMPALAQGHTVIAFDLPGLGTSTVPTGGFDKATTAKRIREGVQKLGFTGQISILAHDVGSLVAYPYARDFPTEVSRLAVLETPLSGFGLENFYGISWHLGFNQTAAPVPETIMDNDDVPTYLGWLFSGAHHPDRIPQQTYFDAYSYPPGGPRATTTTARSPATPPTTRPRPPATICRCRCWPWVPSSPSALSWPSRSARSPTTCGV